MENGYLRIEDLEKYYFPCWRCGEEVETLSSNPILRVFCSSCKSLYEEERNERLREYIKLKIYVMHERALRMLEKQGNGMFQYQEAAHDVLEFALEDPERFDSSHEMIAAMELIRNHVRVKVQQKVLNHRVDFILPDLKVVLEIDGYMHRYSELKDSKRDIEVRKALGEDWEVVRIPTKYIEKNSKMLLQAIKEVKAEKIKIRKQNNGIIPSWYSRRERELYKKLNK